MASGARSTAKKRTERALIIVFLLVSYAYGFS